MDVEHCIFSRKKKAFAKEANPISNGGGELACKFSESARTILRKHPVKRTDFIKVNLPNIKKDVSLR